MAEDLRRSDHLYSVNCGSDGKPPSIALQILTGKTPSYILQNERLQMSRTPPPAHSGLSPSRMGRSPSPAQRPNSRGSTPSRPPSLVHQEVFQLSPSGVPINLSRPSSRGQRLTPSPSQMLQPPGIPILQSAGLICHPGRLGDQLLHVPVQQGMLGRVSPATSIAQALVAQGRYSPVISMPGHVVPTTTVTMPPVRITTPTPPPPQINMAPILQQRLQMDPRPPREATPPGGGRKQYTTSLALAQLLKMRNPTLNEGVVKREPQPAPVMRHRISFEAAGLVQKPEMVGQDLPDATLNVAPPHLIPMAPKFSGDVPETASDAAAMRGHYHQQKMQSDLASRMPRLVRQPQTNEWNSKPEVPKEEVKAEEKILTLTERENLKTEEDKEEHSGDDRLLEKPFNMRVMTLNNFPSAQTGYRATYRSHSVAIHRAKAGSICNTAKSLDLLRQNLQKHINKELDSVIQRYIEEYFKTGLDNIRQNNGENMVAQEHVFTVCRQMLEEAKKMYAGEPRSLTPDNSDNVSDAGSLVENKTVRAAKLNLFPGSRKRRGSSDSDASIPKRKKKGRPPIHSQGLSGRSTPNKGKSDPVKRDGEKWDPDRLKPESQFVMGARANKALGLGNTRGRLYIKHPDVFKYCGDQDDKTWLFESHHMPATGGKAYMLLLEDIKELAESDEYRNCPGLMLAELTGFCVPDWMLAKMKLQMSALRTDVQKPAKTKPKPVMPHFPLAMDPADHLPFSFTTDNNNKEQSDSKSDTQQPSPSNTETLDLLPGHDDDDDDDTPIVSPFTMTGGFECDVSPPALSPGASDLDTLEEDATLSATPFQLQ